ncbi:MAG: hypothetical protein HOP07_05610 [Bacteriovoracaceae bacterium]|nr:hypothetical protein [Bacteriovoracaceae bacterium]
MTLTHSPLHDMLLIDEPTILVVKDAMTRIANWFVLPTFLIALIWEYFNEFKFGEVVKKLIIILAFMGAFYPIHKEGVELSLKSSGELLREISPNNLFLRKWTEVKVKTSEDKMSKATGWGTIERILVPNFNDLLGTVFFLLSKLLIWILKLIYSTIYHLTYVFAPLTAILYFFPITNASIKGTIISSLWCMILPFVLIAILGIVGNSFQTNANNGEVVISSMDQILWLFGVTLLIGASPIFTLGLLKGSGMAMAGTATVVLMTSAASKIATALPIAINQMKTAGRFGKNALFEPSIREILKRENKNSSFNKKLKSLDQKGGLRNPFRGTNNLDERLLKAGLTKEEARSISKLPTQASTNTNSSYIKTGMTHGNVENSKSTSPKQEQETFLFDKSFWNKITPEHRASIRTKYGITGDLPSPNKLYHPITRSSGLHKESPLREYHQLKSSRNPDARKIHNVSKPNLKRGGENEVRNI